MLWMCHLSVTLVSLYIIPAMFIGTSLVFNFELFYSLHNQKIHQGKIAGSFFYGCGRLKVEITIILKVEMAICFRNTFVTLETLFPP